MRRTGILSTSLELVIWSAPLLIIICLGPITGEHPRSIYRPLSRTAPGKPVAASNRSSAGGRARLEMAFGIYPEAGHRHGERDGCDSAFRQDETDDPSSPRSPARSMRCRAETPTQRRVRQDGRVPGLFGNYSGMATSMRFKAHSTDFSRLRRLGRRGSAARPSNI